MCASSRSRRAWSAIASRLAGSSVSATWFKVVYCFSNARTCFGAGFESASRGPPYAPCAANHGGLREADELEARRVAEPAERHRKDDRARDPANLAS